jgi:heterodisulfide reductase subunit B
MIPMLEPVYSYFPGCSLATSAKENNASLVQVCRLLDIETVELEDWNCCGSSSAHCIDAELADKLAMRNLSLAPQGRPLLVACPSCNLHLRAAQLKLRNDAGARRRYVQWFSRPVDDELKIVHFFELFDEVDWRAVDCRATMRLQGLRFAPYYGCMLARPPAMRREKNYFGLMEGILSRIGAVPVPWGYASRCCGTFLSVVRPDIVTPMVRGIIADALRASAECLVTACAMCHLNLEVRSGGRAVLPIFHFSEILALAFGQGGTDAFFERHLIDPRPLLRQKKLIVE